MVGEGEVVVSWSASGVATSASVFVPAVAGDQLAPGEVEAVGTGGDGALWYVAGCEAFAEVLRAAIHAGVGRPLHAPRYLVLPAGLPVEVEPDPPLVGPVTTWRDAARCLGVSEDTVSRRRRARRDRHAAWWASADAVRAWWAGLVAEPELPVVRAPRSKRGGADKAIDLRGVADPTRGKRH